MTKTPIFPKLYYKNFTSWSPIPSWCQFFVEIGTRIAGIPIKPYRCVLGCAIPTKAYAALFSATGVVTSLAHTDQFTLTDGTTSTERLRHLKLGSPLIYRRNNKYTKGILDGWRHDNNQLYLRMKTSQNQAISVPQNLLFGVELLSDETFALPKNEITREIVSQEEFNFLIEYLNSKDLACKLITHSRLDCLIIGSKVQIRREVCENRFAIRGSNTNFIEGSLNMLVRIRELLGNSSAHRTALWASSSSSDEQNLVIASPVVVIFNGAASFLSWRESWRASHWIVLLDQTEPRFDEAVAALNQEYILKRAKELSFDPLPALPSGVEVIAYQEKTL